MSHQISLNELPRALREHDVKVTYPTVWRAVVDGRIPAIRDGRRWFIDPANMPAIAQILSVSA